MKSKILLVALTATLLIYPLSVLSQNWQMYISRGYSSKFESLQKEYYSSQYADKNHKAFIPDETLESYAGGIFLKGINPIYIHHDQPPLGRYIISLSIWVFDNEKTIPLFLLFLSAFGIYLVSRQVIQNQFLSLIPVGIFINQPMFINKFHFIPLLEPIQLPFIIFAIYFFILGIQQKKTYTPWFMLVAIFIGFVISIRFFILGAVLTSSFLLYLLIRKKMKMLFIMMVSLSLSLFVLLTSYFQTFKDGYSLQKVLGIQKYILVYRKSAFTEPFSYWDLLLFNRWHTWWGDRAIISDMEWSILWPTSITIIMLSMGMYLYKKIKISPAEWTILLWIYLYSMMLSVGYTASRYFLPLIPFLYIIATSFTIKLIHVFSPPIVKQKNKK